MTVTGEAVRWVGAMTDPGASAPAHDAALLAAIVESSDDAIMSIDLDGRVTSWNRSAERMFGYATTEIIGRPLALLVPDDRRAEVAEALAATAAGTSVRHMETVRRHRDGRLIHVSVSLSPILSPGGGLIGTGAVVRDVSEQKRNERMNAALAAIVEASDAAIIGADLDGTITTWNQGAQEIYGYTPQEAIGQSVFLLVPDVQAGSAREVMARVAGGERVHVDTTSRRRKDGTIVDLYTTVSPVRDSTGRVVGIGSVARDVTERRRAERVNARLAAVVESTDDAIWTSTLTGEVTSWNPAAERIYGYAASEMLGSNIEVLVPEDRRQEMREVYAEVAAGRAVSHLETTRRRRDGRTIHASVTVSPLTDPDGTVVGASAVVRDITAHVQHARDRERMLRELEDAQRMAGVGSWTWDPASDHATWSAEMYRIFRRDPALGPATSGDLFTYIHPDDRDRVATGYADAFGGGQLFELDYRILVEGGQERVLHGLGRADPDHPGAYIGTVQDVTEQRRAERARAELLATSARAEAANLAKSEFLARMSHELRTPLNAIIGFGQLLQLGDISDEHRESVDYILKGGRHLLALINDVLDIARIESGRMMLSPEPVLVEGLIREAVALVRPLARERDISITVDETCARPDRYVLADGNRLKQVLLNLLSNAIKYNRDAGGISVSCAAAEGRIRISVKDTGFGIAPEHLANLFEPFERLGAERTSIEGTGLGLGLSRGLLEAMGGTIDVSTEPGVGSTFEIELAAVKVPHAGPDAVPVETSADTTHSVAAPARRVLYIEDNLSNLALVQRILARWPGIELISAMQGSIGLELARRHHPDLIILDLQLPDITGADVLERLRTHDQRTPVMVVTADSTKGQAQALTRLGATDFITKPLDVNRFMELLHRHLRLDAGGAPS